MLQFLIDFAAPMAFFIDSDRWNRSSRAERGETPLPFVTKLGEDLWVEHVDVPVMGIDAALVFEIDKTTAEG